MLLPLATRLWIVVYQKITTLAIVTLVIVLPLVLRLFAGRVPSDQELSSTVGFAAIAYAVVLAAGVVSRDLGSGPAQLWLQRPGHPVTFYLRRFAEAAVMAAALTCALGLAVRLAALAAGWPFGPGALAILPARLATVAVVASVSFGISSWVLRGGAIASAGFLIGGALVRDMLVIYDQPFGAFFTILARVLLLPSGRSEFDSFLTGQAVDFPWMRLIHHLLYSSAWIAVGASGVWRVASRTGLVRR